MAKIYTTKNSYTAMVPAGTSTGKNEAKSISVERAIKNFNELKTNFVGLDENEWRDIDMFLRQLDATSDFSNLGANVALAVSIACARASVDNELWRLNGMHAKTRFPFPLGNVMGGGSHGGGTTWQEFLLIPYKAKDPVEAINTNIEIWKVVGEELREKKLLVGRNIENAWMSTLDEEKTLEFLSKITEDWKVKLGIDFAASDFWDGKVYKYHSLKKSLTSKEHINHVIEVAKRFELYYLEDPVHEDDFEGSGVIKEELKNKLIVGDDLYCTNPERLRKGIKNKSTNGIIIKPNQIGTLSQAEEVVKIAKQNKIVPVISHRSGETEDNWIADLAIAWQIPFIKTGIMGAERLSKLNRLIELWYDIPNVEMAKVW